MTRIGVSPVFFYDPPGRLVAVLHPNHTYEKIVFGPWQQETWDANDTVLDDPQTDPDIKGYTAGYFAGLPPGARLTWHARRKDGALGPQEKKAADKAAAHAGTPSTVYFDPLGRPSGVKPSIIRPCYNEANLLERVEVNLHGAETDGQPVWTPFVTKIDYDAKGRRRRVDYGNGVSTFYEYDPFTFLLTHLVTRRHPVSFPGDSPQPPPAGWPGCHVQNLSYTYDPVGNITYIRDNAQQAVYFRNKRVEPDAAYTYDALYRLIEATGREHLGQNPAHGGTLKPPAPHSPSDVPRIGLSHPGDGNAMGAYIERYVYDAAGNILQMRHRGSDPANPGWTRDYTYTQASLIEPEKTNNRLTSTIINDNNGVPVRQHYVYDVHGNVTRMPHFAAHANADLPNMH